METAFLSAANIQMCFAGGMDLSGKIWDAETGALLAGVQDLSMFGANWIEFAPDGKKLVVSMKGGALQLWQLTFGAD